jgi:hypothetical protein
VTYTRLRTDYPRTDPFSGLYLGAFGSVGAQALQLQRFTWEARPALWPRAPRMGALRGGWAPSSPSSYHALVWVNCATLCSRVFG